MRSKQQQVIELLKQGLDIEEIVKQTGLYAEEVTAIIKQAQQQQSDIDVVIARAKLLNDSKLFIKGLAVKAGAEIFKIIETGRVEEIVSGTNKSPAQVLSRKIDLKDLKAASEAIEKLNKILNEEVEQFEQVRTLKIEFVDVENKE